MKKSIIIMDYGYSTNQFEKISSNVSVFNIKGDARFYVSNGELYEWGRTGDNKLLFGKSNSNLPQKVETEIFESSQISKIETDGARKTVVLSDGKLYTCSRQNENSIIGVSGGGIRAFTYDFNADVKQICYASNLTSACLTTANKVYVVGIKAYLGIGSTDKTTYTEELQLSGIDNVEDIVAGKNFFIVIKKDGTVWGTGTNTYGILGRWIGIDRNTPNSRYKTAFEWVECPELEI